MNLSLIHISRAPVFPLFHNSDITAALLQEHRALHAFDLSAENHHTFPHGQENMAEFCQKFGAEQAQGQRRKAGKALDGEHLRTVYAGNLGNGVFGACGYHYGVGLFPEDQFTGDGGIELHSHGDLAELRSEVVVNGHDVFHLAALDHGSEPDAPSEGTRPVSYTHLERRMTGRTAPGSGGSSS